jgi:voltage-gated potassium channel
MKKQSGRLSQRLSLTRYLAARDAMTPVVRMFIGLLITVLVSSTAIVSYVLNGWSVSDAFYMVVITIFGIGYGEVQPVTTPTLRAITICLIITGYAAVIYTVGGFVQFLVDGQLRKVLGIRRMQHDIERLREHTIICGYGRMGSVLAQSLKARTRSLVIVENNTKRVHEARAAGFLAIEGDATEEDVLMAAGIERASVLAAVLHDDASNVFLTITAHELNPVVRILARSEQPNTAKKLRQVGACQVISPTQIGADRLSQLIVHPTAESVLRDTKLPEGINQDLGTIGLQIDELELGAESNLVGGTLAELFDQAGHGFLVVAIRQQTGKIILTPDASQVLSVGDVLIILGHGSDLDRLCSRFALKSEIESQEQAADI